MKGPCESVSDIFCSLSVLFDLFGCVCLLQSSPFAIFDSCEVKNLIYFSLQCHALSSPVHSPFPDAAFFLPLPLFLSGLFFFHNKPLTPLCHRCLLRYGFSPFSVSIPCSRIILYIRMGQCLSFLSLFLLIHTHTHVYM